MKKTLIISHSVFPEKTGQAIMLDRLLKLVPKESYDLLTYAKSSKTNDLSKDHIANNIIHWNKLLEFHFFSSDVTSLVNVFIVSLQKYFQVSRLIKYHGCNSIIVCSGDITDLVAAFIILKLRTIRIGIYMFDDIVEQWTGIYRSISLAIFPTLIKKSDLIIVPNEYLQKSIKSKYAKNSEIIRNPYSYESTADTNDDHILKGNLLRRKTYSIVFTGSIYHAHYDSFISLIKAIEINTTYNFELHVYTPNNAKELAKYGLKSMKLKIFGAINDVEVAKVQKKADFVYLPLAFHSTINEIIKTSAPGKLAEYLLNAKAILAHVPGDSFLNWFIGKHKIGHTINTINPDDINLILNRATNDDKLSRTYRSNSIRLAKSMFDPTQNSKKLASLLKVLSNT